MGFRGSVRNSVSLQTETGYLRRVCLTGGVRVLISEDKASGLWQPGEQSIASRDAHPPARGSWCYPGKGLAELAEGVRNAAGIPRCVREGRDRAPEHPERLRPLLTGLPAALQIHVQALRGGMRRAGTGGGADGNRRVPLAGPKPHPDPAPTVWTLPRYMQPGREGPVALSGSSGCISGTQCPPTASPARRTRVASTPGAAAWGRAGTRTLRAPRGRSLRPPELLRARGRGTGHLGSDGRSGGEKLHPPVWPVCKPVAFNNWLCQVK